MFTTGGLLYLILYLSEKPQGISPSTTSNVTGQKRTSHNAHMAAMRSTTVIILETLVLFAAEKVKLLFPKIFKTFPVLKV